MTTLPPIVLASASPARRQLLAWAGIDVEVIVSGVDESVTPGTPTEAAVEQLATRKARAVAERLAHPPAGSPLVIGCDSSLDLDGQMLGKPVDAAQARAWWQVRRGRNGTLFSGMCLIDIGSGAEVSGTDGALVSFGRPSDDEIEAYVDSGEPLSVAGAFTMEGRGAPFLDRIDGHPSTVMGLSLPLLRRLLHDLTGASISQWWSPLR